MPRFNSVASLSNRGISLAIAAQNTLYTQQGTLTDPTFVGPVSATFAISGDGNTAVYTNSYQTTTADFAGKAWFLARTGASWAIQASYQATGLLEGDRDNYGYSSAISDDGNTIVVGSRRQRETPNNAGAIYVYSRNGTSWSQTQYLQAYDKELNDYFGPCSLSGDGMTLVVGARLEDGGATDGGAVYIYQRGSFGTSFGNVVKLLAPTGEREADAWYGTFVRLSNDASTLAVGANGKDGAVAADNLGAIYLYTRNRNPDGSFVSPVGYTYQAKLTDNTPVVYFGASFKLSGDGNTLIALNWGNNELNLFTRSGSTWTQQTSLTAPEGNIFAKYDINTAGDRIVAGGSIAADGSNTGVVRSFTKTDSTWTQDPLPILPDVASYTGFSDVYLSGDGFTLIVRSGVGNFVYDSPGPTEAYYLTTGTATITGTAQENSTLTASNNLADGDGLSNITYAWNRDGVAITGATATTYTLVTADVGTVITVTVSYTEGGGTSGSVTSLGTDVVTASISFYTHPTFGTLVGSFSTGWQPNTSTIPVTQGIPQPGDNDVILSDANFAATRASATAGRVFYVWGTGSNLTSYREFYRSQIESANVRPAPTWTINPNNFGVATTNYRVHFWSETTGATLSGSDYSMMRWMNTKNLGIYDFGPTKRVSTNYGSAGDYVAISSPAVDRVYIFYK